MTVLLSRIVLSMPLLELGLGKWAEAVAGYLLLEKRYNDFVQTTGYSY
jgi:hypothetical protein